MTSLDFGFGPTLLFIHGVGMRAAAYRPLLDTLAKNFRVIAPDLPGAGGTPLPPGTPTLDDFASQVQHLLDAKGVRPDFVVGHSLGGGVALSLAAARGFPRRLILINSVGAGSPRSTTSLVARFFFLKNLRVVLSPSRWSAVWRVLPHFLATMGFRFRKSARLGALANRAARLLHPALSAPGAHGVFVTATGDELFPPALFRERASTLPAFQVVEVPGAHDWCLLQPEAAAKVLMTILNEALARLDVPDPVLPG